jgi:hypothetical protein
MAFYLFLCCLLSVLWLCKYMLLKISKSSQNDFKIRFCKIFNKIVEYPGSRGMLLYEAGDVGGELGRRRFHGCRFVHALILMVCSKYVLHLLYLFPRVTKILMSCGFLLRL